jgi:hypothetical protein
MSITITIDDDEALVIFECLSLIFDDNLSSSEFIDKLGAAEQHAFNALRCLLVEQIDVVFSPDYQRLLEAARQSLVQRYGPPLRDSEFQGHNTPN